MIDDPSTCPLPYHNQTTHYLITSVLTGVLTQMIDDPSTCPLPYHNQATRYLITAKTTHYLIAARSRIPA